MKKLRILSVVVAALVCAFMLCGCGASVDYYYSSNGNTITSEYVISLPSAVVDKMEKSAALRTDSSDGASAQSKWTVKSYFTLLGGAFGCGTVVSENPDGTVITLSNTRTPSNGDDNDDGENYTREIEKHFFNYKIIYTQDNPFDGLRAQYDGAETIAKNTVMDVIVNGSGAIPGLAEAFPAVSGYSPDELTLTFYWRADVVPENGEIVTRDNVKWVKWDAKFDNEKRVITYSYTRPNPLGWYVVIAGVGALTVAIILLATRKSKKEPRMAELKKGPVHYRVEPDGTIRGDDGSVYRDPFATRVYRPGDYRSPYRTSREEAERAKRELEDIFSGADPEKEEKERLKRRLDELLPPDQAAEAKKKLDDKK